MNDSVYPDICVSQQSTIKTIDIVGKNFWGLLPFAYGFPSVVLDVFIAVFLFSKKGQEEFRSNFYTLFAISSIVEISQWLIYNIVQRLTAAPLMSFLFVWIPKDGIIVSILYFLVSYTGYLTHIPSFLLTTNRLTSVVFPINYEKNWRKWLKPILVVYFLYPLIFTWQYLFMNQVRHCQIWDAMNTTSYHIFSLQSPSYGIPLFLSVTIIAFLVSVSSLIMNVTTMSLLIYRRKHQTSYNNAQRKSARIELNMFILTLLMFFNEFTLGIMFLISYFASPTSSIRVAILVVQPFIVDLTCLTPPWMLIIMSKKVRSKIIGRVFNKISSTVVVISVRSRVQG